MTDKQITKTETNDLGLLKNNTQLATMYQDNSKVGADNLAGETPQLKVHSTGKSSKNELANGEEPTDGYFFYKPTAEQFKTIDIHILTISKGFRAPGIEEGKPDVFNQIMGGVIIEDGEYKPFVMYFTGLKLSNLWEFGKLAAKYTRSKPIGIPMFALTVQLTTEKIANNYGKSWIVKFEIMKNEDGSPKLILDETVFKFLKDNVEDLEQMIAALIEAKEVNKEEEIKDAAVIETQQAAKEAFASEKVDNRTIAKEETVDDTDLPF